jgi:hypothetical protein
VPENQLCSLTPHQARIQSSMEKLNVPAWYKPRLAAAAPAADGAAPALTPRGPRAGGGWRRHVTGNSLSRASTPSGDNGGGALAAGNGLGPDGRTRWSSRTLPLSYPRTGSTSSLLLSPSSSSALSTPTSTLTRQPYLGWRSQVCTFAREILLQGDFFGFVLFIYDIKHCFIFRPSDSTVSEDDGIEPRIVATTALAFRRSNHSARSHLHSARSMQEKYS